MKNKILLLNEKDGEIEEIGVMTSSPLRLKFLQEKIGGFIERVPCSNEGDLEEIVVLCDEEGYFKRANPTLAIVDRETGKLFEVINGNVIFCSEKDGELYGIDDWHVDKLKTILAQSHMSVKKKDSALGFYYEVPVLRF